MMSLRYAAAAFFSLYASSSYAAAEAESQLAGAMVKMLIVVAVLGVVAYMLKSYKRQIFQNNSPLKLEHSIAVGQRERIAIVSVEGKWLVLGITQHQITALSEMPAPQQVESDNKTAPMPFASMVQTKLNQVLNNKNPKQ